MTGQAVRSVCHRPCHESEDKCCCNYLSEKLCLRVRLLFLLRLNRSVVLAVVWIVAIVLLVVAAVVTTRLIFVILIIAHISYLAFYSCSFLLTGYILAVNYDESVKNCFLLCEKIAHFSFNCY